MCFVYFQFLFCLLFVWTTFIFSETNGLSDGKIDHISMERRMQNCFWHAAVWMTLSDSYRVVIERSSGLTVSMFLINWCLHIACIDYKALLFNAGQWLLQTLTSVTQHLVPGLLLEWETHLIRKPPTRIESSAYDCCYERQGGRLFWRGTKPKVQASQKTEKTHANISSACFISSFCL